VTGIVHRFAFFQAVVRAFGIKAGKSTCKLLTPNFLRRGQVDRMKYQCRKGGMRLPVESRIFLTKKKGFTRLFR
jgi:hypothetical protein